VFFRKSAKPLMHKNVVSWSKQRFCALLLPKEPRNNASTDFALDAGACGGDAGSACDVLSQSADAEGAFPRE